MSGSPPRERGQSRAALSQFYGLDKQSPPQQPTQSKAPVRQGRKSGQPNPYDINAAGFDPDLFVAKLVKEASLSQLMAQEGEVIRQIQGLDSDMQTLVYENYNKFIAATETIRKMRVDFRGMEEEMDQLATSMKHITAFSAQVSDKLRSRRQEVSRLSSAHTTLQKLQFILELPNKLKECLSEGQPGQAVLHYTRAGVALEHYAHMPSFTGIQEDCETIMQQLKVSLHQRLKQPSCPAEELGEAVQLLQQLGEPTEQLCEAYLAQAGTKLSTNLDVLEQQAEMAEGEVQAVGTVGLMDPLEFVDHGCNNFLADLCLAVTAYTDTFKQPGIGLQEVEAVKLQVWLEDHVGRYLHAVKRRLAMEKDQAEAAILVRALDRFYRRLGAMGRVVPGLDKSKDGLDIVLAVAKAFCEASNKHLEAALQEAVMDVRQELAAPKKGETGVNLGDLSTGLLSAVADNIRATLATLHSFLDQELSFSAKTYFRVEFTTVMVQEGVLLRHFRHLVEVCSKFSKGAVKSVPPALLLLLSRTCLDLHTSTTGYLAGLLKDTYQLEDRADVTQVNEQLQAASQSLLDSYVQLQAADVSLMLRKSVEARDWLNTVEPRNVRAVMKRVVEDITIIDGQVGELYEEGQRKARSSDSSRRTFTASRSRSAWSSYGPSQLDSSLASNIQKLFSEKIDYFAPVQPSKVSVLTGIIKIALKTLLECVRLKTFSRFGLQQMQVDCHYLQLYLWRFVEDEAVVHHLLDEVMSSVLHRCLDQPPQLMEHSVVEVICDRG